MQSCAVVPLLLCSHDTAYFHVAPRLESSHALRLMIVRSPLSLRIVSFHTTALLLSHALQVLDDKPVRIHKPIHAFAHTRLLVSIQRPLPYLRSHALFEACICQAVNGLLDLRLLTLALDELVEVLFVFGRKTLDKFLDDLGLVHDGNVNVVGVFVQCTEVKILLIGVGSGAQADREKWSVLPELTLIDKQT